MPATADLSLLRVIELYDRTLTREKLRRVLRETRERNGWLIFYTHDVARDAELDRLLAAIAARHDRGGSGREHAIA